jgi:streptogramin lyase
MSQTDRLKLALAGTMALVVTTAMAAAALQSNAQANPYRLVEQWAQLPAGVQWGAVISVDADARDNLWVFHRSSPPILKFDPSGKVIKSFGDGLFVNPHGMTVDRDGNLWVTDAQNRDGKGQQVFKFNPEGTVLMTLGKAGVAREGPDTFNGPCDVLVAPSGDIFVADGHVANANGRIVKFSKDGKFIKEWGKKGSGPGEFDTPHAIALDSKGRLFVGDRNNNRIQIFDQDGKFLEEWRQFSRPSGIFIDKNDVIYVTDSESNARRNSGWKRGIRIGSARDGKAVAFIPDPEKDPDKAATSAAEGVAADAQGNVYGAEVGPRALKKYVKIKTTGDTGSTGKTGKGLR